MVMEENMTKLLLAGVAAAAVMSSAAFAQSYGTMTQSTEVIHSGIAPAPPPPPPAGVKSTRREEIIDSQGNTTVKNQSFSARAGATSRTSSAKTYGPDGAMVQQQTEERTTTPDGETRSTSRTVTTDR
jgi:hypothetical protein